VFVPGSCWATSASTKGERDGTGASRNGASFAPTTCSSALIKIFVEARGEKHRELRALEEGRGLLAPVRGMPARSRKRMAWSSKTRNVPDAKRGIPSEATSKLVVNSPGGSIHPAYLIGRGLQAGAAGAFYAVPGPGCVQTVDAYGQIVYRCP
jgi:hypothetical protein